MKISLYTLTSPIGDRDIVERTSREFLDEITRSTGCEFELKGDDFSDYDQCLMPVIFIRTGGTEGLFKQVFDRVNGYVRLLTSGMTNSLAASMEILSFLQNQGRRGEILHGSTTYIGEHLKMDYAVEEARRRLQGLRLGIVGAPSDWLIASDVDREAVLQKLGIEFVDIPIQEVVDNYKEIDSNSEDWKSLAQNRVVEHFDRFCPAPLVKYRDGAFRIYLALDRIVRKYDLGGFTLRCFDLLGLLQNTGCMSLAMFNSRGIPACCEGDVPTMLTMVIGNALTGYSGFQANPSRIDVAKNEIVFAHCTVPFNMVERYTYDTHFESGIGVGVKGEFHTGAVTIAKVSGDLSRHYFQRADLVRNLSERNLCRTQVVLRGEGFADYFLTAPIGNHHVIFEGDQTALFRTFMHRIN